MSMTNDSKIKVTFAPGFFQNFEGTQEDLDAIVKEIQDAAESGELESKMLSEEDIDDLPEEILVELNRVMNAVTDDGIDLAALEADYKKRLN